MSGVLIFISLNYRSETLRNPTDGFPGQIVEQAFSLVLLFSPPFGLRVGETRLCSPFPFPSLLREKNK